MTEYAERLAERSLWSAGTRSVEADLRSDLSQVLLPFVIDEVGLDPALARQEGTGRAGRFDSMFGDAIVEYKRPNLLNSRRERESAAAQALDYLEDETLGARVVLITDGRLWGILRDPESKAGLGEQTFLDFGDVSQIPAVARFAWRETSVETARAVLDLLESLPAAPVDSGNVIALLGPSRADVRDLLAELANVLGEREPEARTDVLFTQWMRSAGVAYGIADVDQPWPTRPSRARILENLQPVFAERTYAETIYALHTYVALAAKLVAAEVLAIQKQHVELRPSQWAHLDAAQLRARLHALESGELSEQLGAPGLLASDLFDWYAYEADRSESLLRLLRAVLNQFGQLAWARIANAGGMKIDLLRDLYQAVVPRALRKSLGEFFTPRWLAEAVFTNAMRLIEVASESMPRVLDPTCGSGTFLVTAMREGLYRLDVAERGEDREALERLVDSVVGFDINPVSALMSRVNLLLVLGERAQVMPEVAFHVYQADSIVLPRVRAWQLEIGVDEEVTADFIEVPTAIGDFRIARALLTPTRMAILRRNLESALRNRSPMQLFLNALEADLQQNGTLIPQEVPAIDASAAPLYEELARLRDEDRDDVWARVLEQFVAPYLLPPVDLVVGNPPWVSWKDLPDAWKQRSEPIWKSWGLWRSRGRRQGTPLSDISTLMLARSIATYAPRGLVAMLLPQSVLLADPGGNAFRRSHLRPEADDEVNATEPTNVHFRVVEVDDFTTLNPFSPDASNLTVALYVRAGERASFPIPTRMWKRVPRARIRSEWGWARTTESLVLDATTIGPLDNFESPWGRTAEAGSLRLRGQLEPSEYEFGRGYETRGLDGLYTFAILTETPSGHSNEVRVRNEPSAGRNTRDDEPREGVVEADLFWPVVKGEDVGRWRVAESSRYWFVPYSVAGSKVLPLTVSNVAQRCPRLLRYLQPWLGRYLARSMYQVNNDDEFPWGLSGPIEHLRADGALVFVRYIGTPVAAVRTPRFEPRLGRTTLPLPNNKSNIYYTDSVDEAHFLASFINSSPAQSALARFVVQLGVTPAALARLPIPKFDEAVPAHVELAGLGRTAADDAVAGDDLVALEARVDEAVRRLVSPN